MKTEMKVGDLVRNVYEARGNHAVNQSRGWEPIPPGQVGIVLAVRETDNNIHHSKDGKGDVYVDVMLADGQGGEHRCGNYMQTFFEVVAS